MFSECQMTTEVLATAGGNGFDLAVEGSATLCIDPESNMSETSLAPVLVITNTSNAPQTIRLRSGQMAGFSFRAETIADAVDPRQTIGFDPGPINPALVETETHTIPAGGIFRFRGDPRYMLQISRLVSTGRMVNGSNAPPDQRFDRSFRLTYFAFLETGAGRDLKEVTQTFQVLLRVVVRDIANE